ncbi:MAG: tRNA pseudouridine(38-40) synthase TruA [Campylobacterales bacterium]|nr:tRNA pseudouridine(38-40) synthase TruA [Campylobacterales bacterium]
MKRVKAVIEYDGSKFLGYQSQPHKNTVSDKIIETLEILKISSKINGSGRTDVGVHATYQVCDFLLPTYWHDLKKFSYFFNKTVPSSIRLKKIEFVDDSFHARFSAKKRAYRYILTTKYSSPFLADYVTFVKSIDEERVKNSIKLFKGVFDFKLFKKNGSDEKSTIREIYRTNFYKHGDFYVLYFEANGFLRSQVRMMVGFLLQISDKKLDENQLLEQLNGKKKHSHTLVPANGLYLSKVWY